MVFEPSQLPDLTGRIYLVTGANTGMSMSNPLADFNRGKETVKRLVEHHAKVYLAARSEAKATAAIEEIRENVPTANIRFLKLDMMDLTSVAASARDFLSKESELHGLANNAGIMAVEFAESIDGYESQFQTNYLSHWLLTYMLLPVLLRTAATATPGAVRIVNVTSNGHSMFAPKVGIDFSDMKQISGSPLSRYGMSKLANILHSKELHKRYGPGSESETRRIAARFPSDATATATGEIWTASVHPGAVDTNLNSGTQATGMSFNLQPLLKCLRVYSSPEKGSFTSLFAVASTKFESGDSGEYFVPVAKKSKPSKHGSDADMAIKLWDWTVTELKGKGLI